MAFAIRISLHKATKFSPYLLVFKQQPLINIGQALYNEELCTEELLESDVEQAVAYWRIIFKEVQRN